MTLLASDQGTPPLHALINVTILFTNDPHTPLFQPPSALLKKHEIFNFSNDNFFDGYIGNNNGNFQGNYNRDNEIGLVREGDKKEIKFKKLLVLIALVSTAIVILFLVFILICSFKLKKKTRASNLSMKFLDSEINNEKNELDANTTPQNLNFDLVLVNNKNFYKFSNFGKNRDLFNKEFVSDHRSYQAKSMGAKTSCIYSEALNTIDCQADTTHQQYLKRNMLNTSLKNKNEFDSQQIECNTLPFFKNSRKNKVTSEASHQVTTLQNTSMDPGIPSVTNEDSCSSNYKRFSKGKSTYFDSDFNDYNENFNDNYQRFLNDNTQYKRNKTFFAPNLSSKNSEYPVNTITNNNFKMNIYSASFNTCNQNDSNINNHNIKSSFQNSFVQNSSFDHNKLILLSCPSAGKQLISDIKPYQNQNLLPQFLESQFIQQNLSIQALKQNTSSQSLLPRHAEIHYMQTPVRKQSLPRSSACQTASYQKMPQCNVKSHYLPRHINIGRSSQNIPQNCNSFMSQTTQSNNPNTTVKSLYSISSKVEFNKTIENKKNKPNQKNVSFSTSLKPHGAPAEHIQRRQTEKFHEASMPQVNDPIRKITQNSCDKTQKHKCSQAFMPTKCDKTHSEYNFTQDVPTKLRKEAGIERVQKNCFKGNNCIENIFKNEKKTVYLESNIKTENNIETECCHNENDVIESFNKVPKNSDNKSTQQSIIPIKIEKLEIFNNKTEGGAELFQLDTSDHCIDVSKKYDTYEIRKLIHLT